MLERYKRKTNRVSCSNTEEIEQIKTVNYLKLQYPKVLFTISPAGIRLHPAVGTKFKRMGYRAGTPDLLILEPNKYFHGLFIEMKKNKGGKVSDNQRTFLNHLLANNYEAKVANGFNEAIKIIDEYLRDRE
ncbi:MAG: VRR-NUC domain-containing protein [Elusimicrobiales bacterium]|nr:VRR-NUC domain-containing protein [Elusimicrobiales bacterium]